MNNGPDENMFAGIEEGRLKATDDWWIKSLTQFQELSGYFQDNFAGAGVDACQDRNGTPGRFTAGGANVDRLIPVEGVAGFGASVPG